MRRLNPIHGLTLLFLIGLFFLVLFFRHQIPLWRSLLWRYALGAGVLLVLKWCSDREVGGRAGRFINDFSPILYLILIYQSLGDLSQYLRPDVDPQLIRIDFLLFGVHPTVWMERWIVPWLTGVLSVAYLSYFFLPARLVHTLYVKNSGRDFDLAVFCPAPMLVPVFRRLHVFSGDWPTVHPGPPPVGSFKRRFYCRFREPSDKFCGG